MAAVSPCEDLLYMEYSFLFLPHREDPTLKSQKVYLDDELEGDPEDIVIDKDQIQVNNRGHIKTYVSEGGFTKLKVGQIIEEMEQEVRNQNGIHYDCIFYHKVEHDTSTDIYKVVWGWYPADFPTNGCDPAILYKKPPNMD